MDTPIIDRLWAMPSKNTFSIPPFRSLIEQNRKDGVSVDPFANAAGIGLTYGFEKLHIRLVCHGGNHNDTIAVVERKRA